MKTGGVTAHTAAIGLSPGLLVRPGAAGVGVPEVLPQDQGTLLPSPRSSAGHGATETRLLGSGHSTGCGAKSLGFLTCDLPPPVRGGHVCRQAPRAPSRLPGADGQPQREAQHAMLGLGLGLGRWAVFTVNTKNRACTRERVSEWRDTDKEGATQGCLSLSCALHWVTGLTGSYFINPSHAWKGELLLFH